MHDEFAVLRVREEVVDVVEHRDVAAAGLDHDVRPRPLGLLHQQRPPDLGDGAVAREDAVLQRGVQGDVVLDLVQFAELLVRHRRNDVVQLAEEAAARATHHWRVGRGGHPGHNATGVCDAPGA